MGDKHLGFCHCKSVKFSVELPNGFDSVRRCDCSYCRMRGAVVVSVELSKLEVLAGRECLTEYRFNSKQAVHFFCSKCGIYPFHQRRSNPHLYGVNVACLEGVSPFDFKTVQVMNGINHPNDGGGGVAGILSYLPVDS
ncbi:hypothetical protein DAMA08_001300 [Martiniozyma asiatica (nom. inval.)]|nr:hypothetical protein DAMA08_001300 [Martiniozyma asiatica]